MGGGGGGVGGGGVGGGWGGGVKPINYTPYMDDLVQERCNPVR